MTVRGAAGRLALLAGGIVVGAVLGEIALRVSGTFSPASLHLLPPHARLRDVQTEWDVTYETNGAGWRDEDYAPAKPPGVTRIAVVGDSFTFGQGCERGTIFPDLLERLLTGRGEDVQVLNLSNPGVGPEGYSVLLEEALRYQPDTVVVSICGNDASSTRHAPWLNRAVRALSHRFRVFVLLRELRRRVASPPPFPWDRLEGRGDGPQGLAEFHRRYGRARTNLVAACLADPAEVARWTDGPGKGEAWRELEHYVGLMARACRERRCRLVLAVVPDGAQVDPQQLEVRRLLGVPISADALTAPGRLQALVREVARRNGAACLDPLEDFRRVRRGLYFPTDLHWTPAGHRLYAEALAGFLAQPVRPQGP
jgi:lysophospholipase L1-like esterase